MKIEPAEWYDDYDMCCSTTQAVLIVDKIRIPLCHNCIQELKSSLDEFLETYELDT